VNCKLIFTNQIRSDQIIHHLIDLCDLPFCYRSFLYYSTAMHDGMISSTRTLRDSSEATLRLDYLPVERVGTEVIRQDLRTRCRDLEARIELLENALEIDRAHVGVIRQDVQELRARTTSLVDEVCAQKTSRAGAETEPKVMSKESEDDPGEGYDKLIVAVSTVLVCITVGFSFL